MTPDALRAAVRAAIGEAWDIPEGHSLDRYVDMFLDTSGGASLAALAAPSPDPAPGGSERCGFDGCPGPRGLSRHSMPHIPMLGTTCNHDNVDCHPFVPADTPPASAPAASPEAVALRAALAEVGRFAKAHHGNQDPNVWLHALVVDIQDMVERALAAHPTPAPERVAPVALEVIDVYRLVKALEEAGSPFAFMSVTAYARAIVAAYAEPRP